jgi:hypothetical protein
LDVNYRNDIEFTAGSSKFLTSTASNKPNTDIPTPLTVLGGPTANIPTSSNEATSPAPAEALSDSDTTTMLDVTNVVISESTAPVVPPGKVGGKGKGKEKALATIVGAGFTEKYRFLCIFFISEAYL